MPESNTRARRPAPFDPDTLDDVIHGRLRLGVMAYLSVVETATFVELREALGATAGNLSVGLTKLETAGYIKLKRVVEAKRTLTTVRMTTSGRRAWIGYLDKVTELVRTSRP